MGLYHEMQPLTPEQAQRLLQVAHDHRLHASLTVTIATGMRKGELFGLHWQDIDFDAGCLYVRRSVRRVGKFGIVESEPKTLRSRRRIVLPAFVIDALKQHQQAMREIAGKWIEKDIVFSNRLGKEQPPSLYKGAAKGKTKLRPVISYRELPSGSLPFWLSTY